MKNKEKIQLLIEALLAAKDRLEYCGYGDTWEREIADASGLGKKIEDALHNAIS